MERSADERNSTRSADLGRSQKKMPLKCSLPDARRARTKRPADTQQSRPNPQFSFDSKTCGLRKVRLRENTETFDTSRGRAAPPEKRDDVQKKKPAPRTTVLTPPTLAGPIAGEMGFKVEAYFASDGPARVKGRTPQNCPNKRNERSLTGTKHECMQDRLISA